MEEVMHENNIRIKNRFFFITNKIEDLAKKQ